MNANKKIVASKIKNTRVIGTFEGECADSNIVNENGFEMTRQLWETLFSSKIYKQALELGWYIGFAGHPADPDCQDFEHACMVMTDCWIDQEGKVHGKFNLVDTPVGRIVKAFIDAGVTFALSVRGVGDIVGQTVDPDTFAFRGFDLVTFPAFPESIPVFEEVAASTDTEKRMSYKKICAAISTEIPKIQNVDTLNMLQQQFSKNSQPYKDIETQKSIVSSSDTDSLSLFQVKLDAMTKMYIDASKSLKKLRAENQKLKKDVTEATSKFNRQLAAIKRITAAQEQDFVSEIQSLRNKNRIVVSANSKLKRENSNLASMLENSNLTYNMKIKSAEDVSSEKDRIISSMKVKLDETVRELDAIQTRTLNRDDRIVNLQEQLKASQKLQKEYQSAYVSLYASAAGVSAQDVRIKSNMTVSDVRGAINACAATLHVQDKLADEVESTDVLIAGELDESSPITV